MCTGKPTQRVVKASNDGPADLNVSLKVLVRFKYISPSFDVYLCPYVQMYVISGQSMHNVSNVHVRPRHSNANFLNSSASQKSHVRKTTLLTMPECIIIMHRYLGFRSQLT